MVKPQNFNSLTCLIGIHVLHKNIPQCFFSNFFGFDCKKHMRDKYMIPQEKLNHIYRQQDNLTLIIIIGLKFMWQLIQRTCWPTPSNGTALPNCKTKALFYWHNATKRFFLLLKSCKIIYPGIRDALGRFIISVETQKY